MNKLLILAFISVVMFGCGGSQKQVSQIELNEGKQTSLTVKPSDLEGDIELFNEYIRLVDKIPAELEPAILTQSDKRVAGEKANLVAYGQEFEEDLRNLLSMGNWSIPVPKESPEDYTIEDSNEAAQVSSDPYNKVKKAMRLLVAYSDVVEEGGNPELAAQACLTSRHLASRMIAASPTALPMLVGIAVESLSHSNIRNIALRGTWTKDDVKVVQGFNRAPFFTTQGVSQAVKGEWWNVTLNKLTTREFPVKSGENWEFMTPEMTSYLAKNSEGLQRSKSVDLGVAGLQKLVEDLESHSVDLVNFNKFKCESLSGVPYEGANDTELSKWLGETPNAGGIWAVYGVLDLFSLMAKASFKNEASWGLTEVVLAARRGFNETGSLPSSYNDLKTFGLPANLKDPYSGNDYGYDPVRGVAWSVGPDLKDDGGTYEIERWGPTATDHVVKLK